MSRPTVWVIEKKESAVFMILDRVRDGESVRSILDRTDKELLPSFVTFYEWLNADAELSNQYSLACEVRAEKIFEDVLRIADGIDEVDEPVKIQRDRLKIDARKWMLGRMVPKKYGEKIEVDASVNANTTFNIKDLVNFK
jgi:hypothetical protein